jgi:mannose-6-phosphate isomerase-like protein (cupin superfamily)
VHQGRGTASIGGVDHPLAAGSVVVVPVGTPFSLRADGDTDLVTTCVLPVGGQAVIGDDEPFTPPWAC